MAENKMYLAVGEESTRGVKEVATVGFIPLLSPSIPKMEFDEIRRREVRGEDGVKGDTAALRMSRKWAASMEMPFFTEAGGDKATVGTILKHFFGRAVSTQQGATTAYAHMLYPAADPFSTANLGSAALTLNLNINEGTTMKNWPFVGGRVSSISFEQEAGQHLKLSGEFFGQFRDDVTSEIGSPVFAVENLRCDYNNLKLYAGTVTRTGTAPDYTDFDLSSATQIKPDKVSVKIENGMEDTLRLSGLDYSDKTRMGKFKVSVEMTIDWEDPSSGFSSIDEFNSWIASSAATNLCFEWDSGTEAGTSYNHKFVIDIPVAHRMGADAEYDAEKDPMVTLNYEGLYDVDGVGYVVGCFLQNTATSL